MVKKINKIIFLLKAVAEGSLESEEALKQWGNIDEEQDELIAYSWHELTHFDADDDIRKKDIGYDSYQRQLLKDYAKKILEKYSQNICMDVVQESDLQEKILAENRRVHALEGDLYLSRHPEQTNFFQNGILQNSINSFCAELGNKESRILELGCGTGYLYLQLLARGHRMTGVDLSPEMIEGLNGEIPATAKNRSSLTVMAVEEFIETDVEKYDAVVMSALLHHLYDYQSVVRNVCRKLSPGGCFWIFFEPLKQEVVSRFRHFLHRKFAFLDEMAYRLEMKVRGIPLFEEEYDLSDYQRLFGGIDPNRLIEVLHSEGMQIIDEEKYCSRRYGLPAFFASRLLGTQNTFNLLAKKK